jgi:hypothetical protein
MIHSSMYLFTFEINVAFTINEKSYREDNTVS